MGAESAGAPSVTAAKLPGMARVGATVALYLALNSSLNLLNRYTLGHAGFRFPVTLTARISASRSARSRPWSTADEM